MAAENQVQLEKQTDRAKENPDMKREFLGGQNSIHFFDDDGKNANHITQYADIPQYYH